MCSLFLIKNYILYHKIIVITSSKNFLKKITLVFKRKFGYYMGTSKNVGLNKNKKQKRKVINMKKLIKLRKGQYDAYIDDVQEETICDIEYLVLVVMIRVYGKQDDFTDVPIKKYFKSANGENMKLIDFLESAGALLETGEVDLEQLYKYWMTAEVYESEKGTMKIGDLEVGEEIEYEE